MNKRKWEQKNSTAAAAAGKRHVAKVWANLQCQQCGWKPVFSPLYFFRSIYGKTIIDSLGPCIFVGNSIYYLKWDATRAVFFFDKGKNKRRVKQHLVCVINSCHLPRSWVNHFRKGRQINFRTSAGKEEKRFLLSNQLEKSFHISSKCTDIIIYGRANYIECNLFTRD